MHSGISSQKGRCFKARPSDNATSKTQKHHHVSPKNDHPNLCSAFCKSLLTSFNHVPLFRLSFGAKRDAVCTGRRPCCQALISHVNETTVCMGPRLCCLAPFPPLETTVCMDLPNQLSRLLDPTTHAIVSKPECRAVWREPPGKLRPNQIPSAVPHQRGITTEDISVET